MVHVKTCPLVASGKTKRRGRASMEFYRNGVPQIYCNGFMNSLTGEPLEECRECLDWAHGDQVSRDIMVGNEILLKKCPFCGGKATILKAQRKFGGYAIETAYTVACETERCVLEGGGGLYDCEYSAVKAWNRRANDG